MLYSEYIDFEEWNTDQTIDEEILVTVWCVTYNHVEYIEDAIKGFVNQRTDYNYEVVIFDDSSTDGTSDIIRKYAKEYPHLIRAYIAKENTYNTSFRNSMIDSLKKENFHGKYVALCEGDDCWIDENKLQIQIEYMETHPNCVLTLHNALRINYQTGQLISHNGFGENRELSLDDFLFYHGRPETATMVLKRDYCIIPDELRGYTTGDWSLQLYLISQGMVYYFDRIMSVYRFCTNGSWSIKLIQNKKFEIKNAILSVSFLEQYIKFTRYDNRESIVWSIQQQYQDAINSLKEMTNNYGEVLDSYHDNRINKYKTEIIRLANQMDEKRKCSQMVLEAISSFRHVLIWGIGKGATCLMHQFNNSGIFFDGFVIADCDNIPQKYCEKKVSRMDKIPFHLNETIIIVGIYSVRTEELHKILRDNKIQHYIFPYLADVNI